MRAEGAAAASLSVCEYKYTVSGEKNGFYLIILGTPFSRGQCTG